MIIFEEADTFWSPRLTQFDLIITSVADPADLTGKIFTFQNRHNLVNGQLSTSPSSKESILLFEYSLCHNLIRICYIKKIEFHIQWDWGTFLNNDK